MARTDPDARAEELHAARRPFVRAVVVRVERPTSAKPGDRALILPDGTIEGFVGGVCAESTVRLQALDLLESGESTLLRITPAAAETVKSHEGLTEVANPCLSGGTVEIFLEAVIPAPLLHVLGDTPVARALARIGAALDYDVRPTTEPDAPIAPDAAAVVAASHGRAEEAVLAAALRAGVPYVGLVASRRRGPAVVAALDASESDKARLHTPAGLDIGAAGPAEIALSILAEIIESRPRHRAAKDTPRKDTPRAATDPVCGMSVAVSAASLHLEHAGTTWYFCNPTCRQSFAEEPGRFLA
ncbi:MAG TPA: XdhC family protein [Mycobacteriales bacterium]